MTSMDELIAHKGTPSSPAVGVEEIHSPGTQQHTAQ
jgi:hypothetical protein